MRDEKFYDLLAAEKYIIQRAITPTDSQLGIVRHGVNAILVVKVLRCCPMVSYYIEKLDRLVTLMYDQDLTVIGFVTDGLDFR